MGKTISENTSFIIRNEELMYLKNAYQKILYEKKPSVIFIKGVFGIGKTTLLKSYLDFAKQNSTILLGNCTPNCKKVHYFPFVTALRNINNEYLFGSSFPPTVECVYLMDKKGLLLGCAKKTHRSVEMDPDIFVGMLAAVSEFVKDSIRKLYFENISKDNLNILGYDKYRILIEPFPYGSLVAIISGVENQYLIEKMEEILTEIYEIYGDILKSWNGRTDKLKGIENILYKLIELNNSKGVDVKKDSAVIFEAVLKKLISEANKKPTILILEDLEYADEMSIELLEFLIKNITGRLQIIFTASKDFTEFQFENIGKIELKPFDIEHTTSFIDALLPTNELSYDEKLKIYKETGGIPYYIKEYVNFLITKNVIVKGDDGWKLIRNIESIKTPENWLKFIFE